MIRREGGHPAAKAFNGAVSGIVKCHKPLSGLDSERNRLDKDGKVVTCDVLW